MWNTGILHFVKRMFELFPNVLDIFIYLVRHQFETKKCK